MRLISFSRMQERGGKSFLVDRIRIVLRFQAEAVPEIIEHAFFSRVPLHKIAGVKLHAHAVRRKIHGNAALLTQCLCRKPHHAVSGIQHIVVVITARIG